MRIDYPEYWNQHIDSLVGTAKLEVAGFDALVQIAIAELKDLYFPLLALLQSAADKPTCRAIAGLAGIPAGGKSTLAAILQHVADVVMHSRELRVIGMDGWHYPNAILDARITLDENGEAIPLRRRKGGPKSYDIESLRQALEQMRNPSAPFSLPVYDRRLHEPRPDALTVTPATKILVIEGNYVLGGVEGVPEWDAVAELLRPKFFVECDPGLARERILARHIRGGSTPEQAAARYVGNDRINTEIIAATAARANYRIELDPPMVC